MTTQALRTINILINTILCYVLPLTSHIICRTTISQFKDFKHYQSVFSLIIHNSDLSVQNIYSETNVVILH
jgi:hypothetical protein